jgi:uncharacterized membrane protein
MKPFAIIMLVIQAATSLHAFHTPIPSTASLRTSTHWTRNSPLFVFSTESSDEKPSALLRSIEADIEKARKKKEKYEAKLDSYNSKIVELEQKKQTYLDGSKMGTIEQIFSETAARSAAKAIMWRVIAGSVTFITTIKFSRSLATALEVVGSDFFSKALTMFIGERLMNKTSAGRKGGSDSTGRSIAKALVWRLFAICNTLTVCFFFTKDFSMASKIAGSDAIFKTGLMVAYERVWAKIEWGKEYVVEFSI